MLITEKIIVFRLCLTFVLTGILGLERHIHRKNAGFRTHILVGIGSCLVTLIGIYTYEIYGGDVMRLSAQIISGLGFLGSGLIIKEHKSITGLTTAAGLWVNGCIGIAIGTGFYLAAITTVLLCLLTHNFTKFIYNKVERKKQEYNEDVDI